MAWPSPNDYNEAIQSPRNVFQDPPLCSCVPECNQLGLPKPRAGNFAVAYKLQSTSLNWAVKCFTRQPPDDIEQRYAAIEAYLAQKHCPYTVDFLYLKRGIRIQGEWYPIVKMQWVQGDPLHVYVHKNLKNPQLLATLAIQWVQMVQVLGRAQIAHGDLQHGNVLVVNSTLKLVDYDGMFVPALAGKRSTELGQPNYQHPRRTDLDFGPYLDRFSSWVIYVSLVALSIYPSLWQTYRAGDDCLLFRKQDFQDPDHSAVLRTLEHCQNQQLRDLVECFKIALYSSPSDVPSFDAVASPTIVVPGPNTPARIPEWLEDHVAIKTRPAKPASSPDSSWVLDLIAQPSPAPEFISRLVFLRVLFYGFIAGAISATLFNRFDVASMLAIGIASTVLACFGQYRSEPVLALRHDSDAALSNAGRELGLARDAIEEINERNRRIRSVEAEQVANLTSENEKIAADRQKLRDTADRVLHKSISAAMGEKQRLDQLESGELQHIQNTLGASVSSLLQQLNQSQQAESVERSTALKNIQDQHIQTRLAAFRLGPGVMPGIGSYVINNLAYAGIRTAADCAQLRYKKIPSVGARRIGTILAWYQACEAQAKRTMPTTLNHAADATITAKYASSRSVLQFQLSSSQASLDAQRSSIQQKYRAASAPFDSNVATATNNHALELQRIDVESRKRLEVLQDAAIRAHKSANQDVVENEKPLGPLRAALKTAQWRVARARIENGKFRTVRFGRYMREVVFGR